MITFDYDPNSDPAIVLPDRVTKLLKTIENADIADDLRQEVKSLLTALMKEYMEAMNEISWWINQSEMPRARGREPRIKWTANQFRELQHHHDLIEKSNFWPLVEKFEREHKKPQWLASVTGMYLENLPQQYRPTAERLLPLLRNGYRDVNGKRQVLSARDRRRGALAWWHAQFHIGAPEISIETGTFYPPASMERTIQRLAFDRASE